MRIPDPTAPLSDVSAYFPNSAKVTVWRRGDHIDFIDALTGKWLLMALRLPHGGTGFVGDMPIGTPPTPRVFDDVVDDIFKNSGEGLVRSGEASLYQDFFDRLNEFARLLNPKNRRLGKEDEDAINRYCVMLGIFEQIGRNPGEATSVLSRLAGPLAGGGFTSVKQLLGIVEPDLLSDMRELFWNFYDQCNHLLSLPHTFNPTLEGSLNIGGANPDLIVDGTLIEIKSTITSQIETDWLWQALGYVLLDYSDEHKLNAIALYMARQGLYLRWDLEEALRGLCGEHPPSIEELRAEFKEMLVSFLRSSAGRRG